MRLHYCTTGAGPPVNCWSQRFYVLPGPFTFTLFKGASQFGHQAVTFIFFASNLGADWGLRSRIELNVHYDMCHVQSLR